MTNREVLEANLSAYGRRASLKTFSASEIDALNLSDENMGSRKTAMWLIFLRWSRLNTALPLDVRRDAAWIAAGVLYGLWCETPQPNESLYVKYAELAANSGERRSDVYAACGLFIPLIQEMDKKRTVEKTSPSLTNMVMAAARGRPF